MLPACYLDEGILADTNLATNDTANKVELLCICSIISERQNRPDQVLGTEAEICRLKDTARKRERDNDPLARHGRRESACRDGAPVGMFPASSGRVGTATVPASWNRSQVP
jgi:hypothetical protein